MSQTFCRLVLLAGSIAAPADKVVGGILIRGPDGKFLTNESSGHFHENWPPELRQKFAETMEGFGLPINHTTGF